MIPLDRNSKNISFLGQLGILLGFIGAGLFIGGIVSILIWMAMTGRPLLEMEKDMLRPQYYNAIMTLQVVSTFLCFFYLCILQRLSAIASQKNL